LDYFLILERMIVRLLKKFLKQTVDYLKKLARVIQVTMIKIKILLQKIKNMYMKVKLMSELKLRETRNHVSMTIRLLLKVEIMFG